MTIDITNCNKINITDCCAIWNVLSSQIFYSVLEEQSFVFSCTEFVLFECLVKKRTTVNFVEAGLKIKLEKMLKSKKISSHQLSIEDLRDEQIMAQRNQLGKGELSSIAFAKKTGLCFLTDDQKARKIAKAILGDGKVQTTPHLFGWLLYNGHLSDSDLEPIIKEHRDAERPLETYFRRVHEESWRIKLFSIKS